MSSSIVCFHVVHSSELRMRTEDVRALRTLYQKAKEAPPWGSFMASLFADLTKFEEGPGVVPTTLYVADPVHWYGEEAAYQYDVPCRAPTLIGDIGPRLLGLLEAVVVFEGGGPPVGLRIYRGVAEEVELTYSFGEAIGGG